MNPLGLPRNFDVVPDFETYAHKATTLGTLLSNFEGIANDFLLQSKNFEAFGKWFKGQLSETKSRIDETNDELGDSMLKEINISTAIAEVTKMINRVNEQIKKAEEAMKQEKFSFRSFVGNVGQLASTVGAVMSVVAAVPTGGASLLALAPNIMTLTDTIYNNSSELVQAIIDDKETETLTDAKQQFDTVKQNASDVIEAGQKITDMTNVIKNIRDGGKEHVNSELILFRKVLSWHMSTCSKSRSFRWLNSILNPFERSLPPKTISVVSTARPSMRIGSRRKIQELWG